MIVIYFVVNCFLFGYLFLFLKNYFLLVLFINFLCLSYSAQVNSKSLLIVEKYCAQLLAILPLRNSRLLKFLVGMSLYCPS